MKRLLVVAIYLCQTITLLAQVKINELMASNATTLADNAGDYSDWIELYNSTDNPIDLAGYYLTDNYANLTKFRFTTTLGQVVVPAKGYLIVWASSAITKGVRHTNFSLSATGEQLALVMADGVSVVDSLSFDVQRKDVSFGRLPDGGSTFKYFASPTPNINNSAINSFDELLSSPLFSQVGGFYSNSFTLHITHPDTAVTIYYTTDGSIPTAANLTPQTYQYQNTYPDSSRINDYRSFLYESSLLIENPSGLPNKISNIATTHSEILDYLPTAPIEKGKIIRAIATKSGALSSEIVSNSYFFSPSGLNKYTLPVISVMSQEDGFFSFNDGIYVPGVDFEHWRIDNPTEIPDEGSPSNYRREGKIAERTAHFEIIETDTVVYKQAVGIRINGGWSRAFRVKSLRLYGTDEYNTISYPLLPQLPYSDYKTMILRNAGNDYSGTLFRDALVHGSVAHLKIDIQEYRPSILFLNGEYWGIHNIRQRQDKHYYSQKYGVNKDSLDIIGDGIEEGSDTLYQSMLNYILDHDLADSTHYNYVTTQMDVESFMDYQITEIFYNNQDWGVNNIKYWRLKTPYNTSAPYGHDGKWRWSLYDADATISNWTEDRLAIASSFTNWEDAGFLLGKLLQNQNFKCKFINRFADLINTCFLTSHLTQLIQNKRDAISAEIPAHLNRWKTLPDSSAWLETINQCITFFQERPAYQRLHIQDKFGITNQFDMTINVSNVNHGYVKINTIDVLPSTPGVGSAPYPWTGIYFANIPVKLIAKAKAGYKFKHWLYNSTQLTDSIQVVNSDSSMTYIAVFESAVLSENPIPNAAMLNACGYEFVSWPSTSAAGTSPNHLKFVYMEDSDPGLNSAIAGFTTGVYNLTSATRIKGLGTNGVSFINTGSGNTGYPGTKLGGVLLALNTENKSDIKVKWTGRTLAIGAREYGIRLQYRIGDIVNFIDLLNEMNQVVDYSRGAANDSTLFEVKLPNILLNQPYIQLLWRYYHKAGTSGNRDELGVDNIFIETKKNITGTITANPIIESEGIIHATSIIEATSNTLHEAKKYILLNPGFIVKPGAVFKVQIKGCP